MSTNRQLLEDISIALNNKTINWDDIVEAYKNNELSADDIHVICEISSFTSVMASTQRAFNFINNPDNKSNYEKFKKSADLHNKNLDKQGNKKINPLKKLYGSYMLSRAERGLDQPYVSQRISAYERNKKLNENYITEISANLASKVATKRAEQAKIAQMKANINNNRFLQKNNKNNIIKRTFNNIRHNARNGNLIKSSLNKVHNKVSNLINKAKKTFKLTKLAYRTYKDLKAIKKS